MAIFWLVVAGTMALSGFAEARAPKPKVPPGLDPGGVAVAVIGGGIDYRRPDVARRLARDGEGEIIGWDFGDNDARPFSESDLDRLAVARLMSEAPETRLVTARVPSGRHDQIAAALRFSGGTPARIVLVVADPGTPLPPAGLSQAASHLPNLLLVVPARRLAPVPFGASTDRAGLLLVSVVGGAQNADVAVPADLQVGDTPANPRETTGVASEDEAAASVAALAARLVQTEPRLSGASLRARILALATLHPAGPPSIFGIAGIARWK